MAKAKVLTLEEANARLGADKLTLRQFTFCVSYHSSRNGMKSIRDAGFNHRTPGSQSSAAHRLLRKDKIKQTLKLLDG